MIPAAPLPPPVRPGARVGVAALSGAVDPERLRRGLAELARLGLEPVPARNLAVVAGSGQVRFAGDDTERLAAFHELAADTDLPAIPYAPRRPRRGQGSEEAREDNPGSLPVGSVALAKGAAEQPLLRALLAKWLL